MEIRDNTFLVTGGSSGLGEACVRRLAGLGARVVIADINGQAGEALVADLRENARFVHTDVTSERNVQAAVDLAVGNLVACGASSTVPVWPSPCAY